jgi:hypothetical protein
MTDRTPEERIAALGLTLPAVPVPVANYVPFALPAIFFFSRARGPGDPTAATRSGAWAKTQRLTTDIERRD